MAPWTRGYIPKVFAFKNPHPLNPEESDLFYFLLICTKRPKSPKFQRAVSSSSELHAIQRTPRETTTVAFLLVLLQKFDSRGMRKSLHKVPTVLDFANSLIIAKFLFCRSVAFSFCYSVVLLLRLSVAPLLFRSVSPSLRHSIALFIC